MANGKLREARTSAERLAAILVMVIHKNEATNIRESKQGKPVTHILGAEDFLEIVQPFLDLAEATAELAHNTAGKVISMALREKTIMEVTARQSTALFQIAELIRKLELPDFEETKGAGQ